MMSILPEIQFDREKTVLSFLVNLKAHAVSTLMLWIS